MSHLSSSSGSGQQQSVSPAHSTSSLLQLHRPATLSDQSSDTHKQQQLQVSVSESDDLDQPAMASSSTCASSPTSSLFASAIVHDTPHKSLSSSSLLNMSIISLSQRASMAVTAPLSRIVSYSSTEACESTTSSSSSTSAAAESSAMGELHAAPLAKPRSQWQPDEESALCNHPLCTALFGSSTFSLGPRRHHCRMCGLIFCNDHSSRRVRLSILDSNLGRVQLARVCDSCFATSNETSSHSSDTAPLRRGSATNSLESNTTATTEDEYLVTPGSESANPLARHVRLDDVTEINEPELAPIQDWMGKSGVLSLYPLAVHPSHARSAAPQTPSVGPLFAPTISERRSVRVKELERLTLQQRRMGKGQPAFSIPGAKRREGWSSDDDAEDGETPSSFVVGGSAMFRPRIKHIKPVGLTTPTRELDWSTF